LHAAVAVNNKGQDSVILSSDELMIRSLDGTVLLHEEPMTIGAGKETYALVRLTKLRYSDKALDWHLAEYNSQQCMCCQYCPLRSIVGSRTHKSIHDTWRPRASPWISPTNWGSLPSTDLTPGIITVLGLGHLMSGAIQPGFATLRSKQLGTLKQYSAVGLIRRLSQLGNRPILCGYQSLRLSILCSTSASVPMSTSLSIQQDCGAERHLLLKTEGPTEQAFGDKLPYHW